MSTGHTDRIEKRILLRAPHARVWRALTDAEEFGKWFGVKLDGPFTPGALRRGVVVPTTADAAVAKAQEEYKGMPFEITVDRVEPERLFAFRWHPFAVERGVDYSLEPATLVVFGLEDVADGVMLTVTESGFDRIPLARRAKAFAANEEGWAMVVTLIEKHLAQAASCKSEGGAGRICLGLCRAGRRDPAPPGLPPLRRRPDVDCEADRRLPDHASGHHQTPARDGKRRARAQRATGAGERLAVGTEAPRRRTPVPSRDLGTMG